jgi:hypothetical protein
MKNVQSGTATIEDGESELAQTITLYPTFGHLSPDEQVWRVAVSGVIYGPSRQNLRRRMFVRVLQQLLRVPGEELENELFQRRVNQFLVTTARGHRLAVDVGSRRFQLQRPSKRNGHFRGSFDIGLHEAREHCRLGIHGQQWLPFQMGLPIGPTRPFLGSAQLITPHGVSVVSDIDDTIKLSEVGDRRRLLQNTFLREFVPVEGMAERYRSWSEGGAAFHYVSSSPWQLYSCLKELQERSGFPDGSYHLRPLRLRDPSVLRLFVARRALKRQIIESIVSLFPERRFVLLGDSGEGDPEIYGAVARQSPEQVVGIWIRRVVGRPLSDDRLRRVFRDLRPDIWRVFEAAEELPTTLAHLTMPH